MQPIASLSSEAWLTLALAALPLFLLLLLRSRRLPSPPPPPRSTLSRAFTTPDEKPLPLQKEEMADAISALSELASEEQILDAGALLARIRLTHKEGFASYTSAESLPPFHSSLSTPSHTSLAAPFHHSISTPVTTSLSSSSSSSLSLPSPPFSLDELDARYCVSTLALQALNSSAGWRELAGGLRIKQEGSTLRVKLEAEMPISAEAAICVLREADLYHTWFPRCVEAATLYSRGRMEKVFAWR